MLEIRRKSLNEKNSGDVTLTDLSKAFECLNHKPMDLKEREQQTKVSGSYSTWRELKFGASQGSILGPLLYILMMLLIY